MENNVVSLETAKKLRAAGFPQKAIYRWYQRQDGTAELQRSNTNPWGEHIYAAPTAQEIANEFLSSGNTRLLYYGGKWSAVNHRTMGTGTTIGEALADLWLRLQEENHD